MLKDIQERNPHITIHHVKHEAFSVFGRVLEYFPVEDALQKLRTVDTPPEGNIYVRSVPEWEQDAFRTEVEQQFYGEMPVQIGYCNGNSSTLRGLEFHKGSEINVGASDFILLVGSVLDITENRYDTENIQAFYVPEATAVELFQTTLHLAPCKTTEAGFRCMVVLPRGTNAPLDYESDDKLLFMKNKWLLSHPENRRFLDKGAYPGMYGPDIYIYCTTENE
ncbi:DUF4867 family protein [Salibacterium halotolerans]|uniref:DUF4867 domain-containing protein n=1 Tax=Salibacterium halotolerans TaxID=1884432 RepID=A0A1I5LB85_9BACI|nr:DUF4867 family protein [Salibacterium halotolerans]SFO94629.1 protein of unknown function [Salibacterium halotolerans]